jgi:hypothetical protein
MTIMRRSQEKGYLKGARVYLSGPMDFVASREEEKKNGWRVRVKQFLQSYGATVFDPWEKPKVRGLHEYGKEDVVSIKAREKWTFEEGNEGAKIRAECAQNFYETMHIDLRMVDISDFVIAYCPTNIYSVGTPHEIITARNQHKPVLFVSTPVVFPALDELKAYLNETQDKIGTQLLVELEKQVPIKSNPKGIPSLWYMPLIGANNFFDGFGFCDFKNKYGWKNSPSDEIEKHNPPKQPLLKFLESLNKKMPQRWNLHLNKSEQDDDWLLLDIERYDGHFDRENKQDER